MEPPTATMAICPALSCRFSPCSRLSKLSCGIESPVIYNRKHQKTRPLHHGGTETRSEKINGFFSDRVVHFGFIQGRVSIFRTCLPSRKMRARKNKGGGLDFRATQPQKILCFLRSLCI